MNLPPIAIFERIGGAPALPPWPDVQPIVNEALGIATAVHNPNTDGAVDMVDTQIVMNAALGLLCTV